MKELEQGQTYKWKQQVKEGTMRTRFKVLEDNGPEAREGHPPHYMCEIQKVTVDGGDVTEEYIQKSFDGENVRGIPEEKISEMDLKEMEEGKGL